MIAGYRSPADSVGGTPRLTVDRRNLKIAGLLERQCLGLIALAVDGHRWQFDCPLGEVERRRDHPAGVVSIRAHEQIIGVATAY